MRRLPIYFLIDVSESMVGEPIKEVQEGMRTLVQTLRSDPYSLETVHIGIIIFAGKAKVIAPLTEIYKFYPPEFPIGGGTSLGKGLDCLMDDIDKSVVKTTTESKGDWKPIVFLFTDGTPTDNPDYAITRWNNKYRKHANIVVVSFDDNTNTQLLGKLSDNVLRLNETTQESFKSFFKWVTDSIRTSSVSVSNNGVDDVALAPHSGFSLEKVDTSELCVLDENFAVIRGKCSETGKQYLVKYAKRFGNFFQIDYKLVGAYPIDGETYESLSNGNSNNQFNINKLNGIPVCPCCGNQYALLVCECGNVFCMGDKPVQKCPWCGLQGQIARAGSEGVNINRGQG
ncbi:MAG: VWA domain-containing protein [Bacteroidales bacterium]|nr:VWA domain-containing protein [Bacteroidales bacterium]